MADGPNLSSRLPQFQFGRDQLGPIFADYLSKLSSTIQYFGFEQDAKILYVARAGLRIKRLYDLFNRVAGITGPPAQEIFWTSRLMTLKGTWSNDPEPVFRHLSREFAGAELGELVVALLRDSDQIGLLNYQELELRRPATQFRDFIWGASEAAHLCRWHLTDQSNFFGEYVDTLLGDRRNVLLVDSGWQGTAQTLLTDWRPDITWWGAYFGRIGTTASDRRHWRQMIGLCFEADEPDPTDPATAMVGHRHLIEDVLEPRAPSIERLWRGAEGVTAPQAAAILMAEPTADRDAIFLGVESYISDMNPWPGTAEILAGSQRRWPELAKTLLFPSKVQVQAISDSTRSADFGRDLAVPLVLPAKDRHDGDDAEQRITDALWPAAQVAIEYPKDLVTPRQVRMWGFRPEKAWSYVPGVDLAENICQPAIAIVTRTMDRVIFLKRAIASVIDQTFDDYIHVIVCDGGDIDAVRGAVEESSADLRRTVLIDNVTNRGMEAASNIAIREVNSEFIVIHDDDDTWDPEFLTRTLEFLKSRRGRHYAGVITNSWHVSEDIGPHGIRVHERKPHRAHIANVSLMEMALGNVFPPIAFVFRRKAYDEVGGFDESLPVLGDWDFNLRILARADIAIITDRLANYHHRDRGGAGLFSNSVIGGLSSHAEYEAVVRNKFLRGVVEDTPTSGLGVLVNLGLTLNELRGSAYRSEEMLKLRRLSAAGVEGDEIVRDRLIQMLDDRWVALSALVAREGQLHDIIAERDREISGLRAGMAEQESKSLLMTESVVGNSDKSKAARSLIGRLGIRA